MKKVMFICPLVLLLTMSTNIINAQSTYRPALQKGSVNLDGGFVLSFGKVTDEFKSSWGSNKSEISFTSFTLSPKANFFIANGLAIGLATDLTSITYKSKDADEKSSMTEFSVGPAIKYYTPVGFFFQGNYTFGKSNFVYEGESEDGTNISKWQLGAGYVIFLNNHVSIEPGMMYRTTGRKSKTDNYETSEKMGEFVISVGLNIFIHKKTG